MSISILAQNSNGLKNNQKVFVKLLAWVDPEKLPTGEVIKILGEKGNNNVEMEAIVLEKGFELGFPNIVEIEASKISHDKTIPSEEVAKRRDIRGTTTFTIDPFDAK
ncbi:MAG: hypothetical protein NTY70_10145, partial [Burkholderiales bacterium]|nr:hypothetical protein [Burkholderiales bacterium]